MPKQKYQAKSLVLPEFMKPFFVVLAMYSVAMLSVWRGGVSFVDDMGRAIYGYAWSSDFNRWSQSWLSYALNSNFTLADISPLPQIAAMMFLASAGVIVTYLFCGKEIKYLPLTLSAFIGLSPFTIENWLYKFDAPGMAMSILVSIAPFLFWHVLKGENGKKWWLWAVFTAIATACLMVMLTSYQAGSGIYLVMVLALAFFDFLDKRGVLKIIKSCALFSVPYLLASLIFRFVLPQPSGWRDTEMLGLSNLLPGLMNNIRGYSNFLSYSLNTQWTFLLQAVFWCFVISLLLFSKRKGYAKILDAAFGMLFVIISIPLSHGVLLLLVRPPVNGRSSMGIGLVIAIVGMIIATRKPEIPIRKFPRELSYVTKYLLVVPAVILLYSFAVFPLALGNALVDQQRWGIFRTETLLADLSRLYPCREELSNTTVQVRGGISLSRVAAHVNRVYPITERIITHQQRGLGGHGVWALQKLLRYYGWYPQWSFLWANEVWDDEHWEIVLDSYFHTVRDSGDGRVSVEIK